MTKQAQGPRLQNFSLILDFELFDLTGQIWFLTHICLIRRHRYECEFREKFYNLKPRWGTGLICITYTRNFVICSECFDGHFSTMNIS